jgi:hypothetical protein
MHFLNSKLSDRLLLLQRSCVSLAIVLQQHCRCTLSTVSVCCQCCLIAQVVGQYLGDVIPASIEECTCNW